MSNIRDTVSGVTSKIDTLDTLVRSQMSSVGSVLNGNKSESSGGVIDQPERAYTIRPRSTPLANELKYSSDRGPYASIRLLSDKSKEDILSLTSVSSDAKSGQALSYALDRLLSEEGYSDFLLTNVEVSMNEKVQINEVFGDSEVVYYFGRSPIQFNLSGIVFDDVDNNWFYNFITSYWGILRGTQMAKNYQLAKLNLPNMSVVGTIMGIAYSQDSSRDTDIRFNMQFLAKSIIPRPVLLPSEILNNNAVKLDLDQAGLQDRFQDKATINSIKRKLTEVKTFLGSSLDIAETEASKMIQGFGSTVSGAIASARGYFDDSVTGILSVSELRANLLSPVYGVLTTLTKVVKSITGEALSFLSDVTSPLRDILRDVRTIANEAISLINAVEDGIDSIVGEVEDIDKDIRKTIQAIRNTSGAISRSPENVTNILKRLDKVGRKKGALASLKSGKRSKSKQALLNSGSPYTAESGASIR